jgi:histidinol-phosphate aminotransferase
VVVDEAYVDFSGRVSWSQRLADFPNLVVLQTLSKAWGLAALRLGMAFSNSFIINILNKIKYPYNVSAANIEWAEKALKQAPEVQEKVAHILAERQHLALALTQLPMVQNVFPSDANFLLIRVKNADATYHHLIRHGVVVRNRSKELHCENCLRITVGTAAENRQLLTVLSTMPLL